MDSIRLSQISEALNYDENINSMVFNLEKKNMNREGGDEEA